MRISTVIIRHADEDPRRLGVHNQRCFGSYRPAMRVRALSAASRQLSSFARGQAPMSGLVTGLVLKYSRSKGITRLVAVAIADCCKDDGKGAWPSMPTIAARACASVRTAQRSVGKLVQLGECRVTEGAGPHGTNLYEIRVERLLANKADAPKGGANLTGDKLTGGDKSHPRRCQNVRQGGDKTTSPDPSSEPSGIRPQAGDKSPSFQNGTGNSTRKCTHLKCGPEGCIYAGGENRRELARVDFNRELEQVEMRAAIARSREEVA